MNPVTHAGLAVANVLCHRFFFLNFCHEPVFMQFELDTGSKFSEKRKRSREQKALCKGEGGVLHLY